MAVAPELRVLWNREISKWTLIIKSPVVAEFEDAHLYGWAIVTHFEPEMRGDAMQAVIRGMTDSHAHGNSPEKTLDAYEEKVAAAQAKAEKESEERLDTILEDARQKEAAVTRDYEKWAERTKDSRHRAHSRTRKQIAAGAIPTVKV